MYSITGGNCLNFLSKYLDKTSGVDPGFEFRGQNLLWCDNCGEKFFLTNLGGGRRYGSPWIRAWTLFPHKII